MEKFIIDNKDDCCGCTACVHICPQEAIKMEEDWRGYLFPHVDNSKCINCMFCRDVCPSINFRKILNYNEPRLFAVQHMSDKVLFQSTSGGMFTAVSSYILENNGYVYGAVLTDDFTVNHIRADDIAKRDKMRGSKYVQSNMNICFSLIRDDLTKGENVLFTGTPCQIAGLLLYLNMLQICTENLFTCDILCRGVPSPRIFKDYIQMVSLKYSERILTVSFRTKDEGWRRGQKIKIVMEDSIYIGEKKEDPYCKLFYLYAVLRPCCYKCIFACKERVGDLSLGDFWGIGYLDAQDNDKGASLVSVNTSKGKYLLVMARAFLVINEYSFEEASQRNDALKSPATKTEMVEKFWDCYRSEGFTYAITHL